MDPASWQELKALFEEAAVLDQSEWEGFAAAHCQDEQQRADLLDLLASNQEAPRDFLQSPIAQPGSDETIGDYTLGAVLGVGGMGTVYEATQDSPRRSVALKVMRSFATSGAQARRIAAEAEILGRLQHPGIARIHAAGTEMVRGHEAAWFAMELVPAALPITTYAERHKLGEAACVRLFLQVCDAVQYAHHKGVIHRDLKPGNILVGDDGVPRVIDFGVAHSVGTEASDSMRTQAGELIGTLAYMSPEQCRGDVADVDTRSDVYALGTVLYELLTTRLPFDVAGKPVTEALRIIDHKSPMRDDRLKGDMEAIVFKALEKAPERRYLSVQALAEDIGHHLRSEPIRARPPSLTYQLRLFARRNRAGFVATIAVLVGMAVAAVVSINFGVAASARALEAEAAKATADEERDAADRSVEILLAAIAAANPMLEDKEVTVRELLAGIEIDDDNVPRPPRIRARLHQVLASAHNGLGKHRMAVEHSNKSLAALQKVPGGDDALREQVLEIRGVANVMLLDHEAAERDLRAAMELAGNLRGSIDKQIQLLSRLGGIQSRRRQWAAAANTLQQAKDLADENDVAGSALGELCANLGTVHFRNGHIDQAEACWSRSLELFDEELWRDHPIVVQVRSNYGLILKQRGDIAGATRMFEAARDSARRRFGDDSLDAANAIDKLAFLYLELAEYQKAEAQFREVLAIREKCGRPEREVALAHQRLGYMRIYEGRYEDAVTSLQRALQLHRTGLSDDDPDVAATRLLLGRALLRADRHAAARPHLQAAVDVRIKVFGADSIPVAMASNALGWCMLRSGDHTGADRLMRATYPAIERAVGRQHMEARAARERMAELCERTNKAAEAEQWRAQ